ncbi:methyltransferase domain-containing protein [Prochlorococcus sp. MIT 1011]|uniref:methyltransferase domain-containing protein n=1 Tax=Prochlorococcus sp. MIT 1011 TaxID=3082520 RepID=UPI0039B64C98
MTSIGDAIKAENTSWSFGEDVAKNFKDHVSKSVPFYLEGRKLIRQLRDFFLHPDSRCYELGSSTGLLSHKIAKRQGTNKSLFFGIDSLAEMIELANSKYDQSNVSFINADVVSLDYEKSILFIAYYLVQFIRTSLRQVLLDKIYKLPNWAGDFFCFEKTRASDARFQDINTSLYTEYKLEQDYNHVEIAAKSRILKRVPEPFSKQGNIDLFKTAGCTDVISIFKYLFFEGFFMYKVEIKNK